MDFIISFGLDLLSLEFIDNLINKGYFESLLIVVVVVVVVVVFGVGVITFVGKSFILSSSAVVVVVIDDNDGDNLFELDILMIYHYLIVLKFQLVLEIVNYLILS